MDRLVALPSCACARFERVLAEGDSLAGERRGEHLVVVAFGGAGALTALVLGDQYHVMGFVQAEQLAEAQIEPLGDACGDAQRRARLPPLDLAEHRRGDLRALGEIAQRETHGFSESLDSWADDDVVSCGVFLGDRHYARMLSRTRGRRAANLPCPRLEDGGMDVIAHSRGVSLSRMLSRPLTAELVGTRVSLVPISSGFAGDLFAALDHEDVWRWIPVARPLTEAEFEQFFSWLLNENEAGRMGTFITLDTAGTAIGTSSYMAIRDEHDGVEIGSTMVSPTHWGTGANVEAKLLMLDHAFNELGCQRVEFKTDARNERSRKALEAIPAQFEGIFRKHMNTSYGLRDSAYYSVIDEDWPAVRASLLARNTRR